MSRADIALRYIKEQQSETEERVRRGIGEYRMGEATLSLSDGTPLPDTATVRVEQKSHEYRFGANLFMLDEFESEEKNARFREKFPELFNLATLPFYWKDLEPVRGQPRYAKTSPRVYRRPAIDLCLDYCTEKGIEPKAHCLNYDNFTPQWLVGAGVTEHKQALEKRFCELAERYADRIPSWEVTNESFNCEFVEALIQKHHYSDFFREKDYNLWSFQTADKYFPNNRLIINDHQDFGCMAYPHGLFFGERSPYYLEIERLLMNGAHLDSVGFQYHCFFSPDKEEEISVSRYNPRHWFTVLDAYKSLGKKLQITEMTVSAFGCDEENEEVQAELLKALYSVFFSHPAMEAIIYWNVFDGYAYGHLGDMTSGENKFCGGLCAFDGREKPGYRVLRHLIREVWHTSCTLSPENGKARFKGFYGDYDAEIHCGERTFKTAFSLSAASDNHIKLDLPPDFIS